MKTNFTITVFLVSSLILFIPCNSFSQGKNIDLIGYQEYKWGMSKKEVKTILNNQKIKIQSSESGNIEIESKIELDGFPSSVKVKKTFMFLNGLLGRIALIYMNDKVPYNIKKIYSQFRDQLEKKYGNPDTDTTANTGKMILGISYWKYNSGSINLKYIEFPETSEYSDNEMIKGIEFISINYSKNNWDNEMEMFRNKKRDKEF